jgi:hypothetical protein
MSQNYVTIKLQHSAKKRLPEKIQGKSSQKRVTRSIYVPKQARLGNNKNPRTDWKKAERHMKLGKPVELSRGEDSRRPERDITGANTRVLPSETPTKLTLYNALHLRKYSMYHKHPGSYLSRSHDDPA